MKCLEKFSVLKMLFSLWYYPLAAKLKILLPAFNNRFLNTNGLHILQDTLPATLSESTPCPRLLSAPLPCCLCHCVYCSSLLYYLSVYLWIFILCMSLLVFGSASPTRMSGPFCSLLAVSAQPRTYPERSLNIYWVNERQALG